MINKIYLLLTTFTLFAHPVFAEEPVIKFTTTTSGDLLTVSVRGIKGNAIKIDFGNGMIVTTEFSDDESYHYIKSINNMWGPSTVVKIYSKGITGLNVDECNLIDLDVTKSPELKELHCNSNELATLDLSNNLSITELECKSNRLTSIILNNNNSFIYFDCWNNSLANLDFGKNTTLYRLRCSHNRLLSLNLGNSTKLKYIDCEWNRLSFATLPQPKSNYVDYKYGGQQNLVLIKTNYNVNEIVDLSSQLTAKDINNKIKTTIFIWKSTNGNTLKVGSDYTENNGKFLFLNTITDSVYCEMTNPSFPNNSGTIAKSIIKTTKFTIGGSAVTTSLITLTTALKGASLNIRMKGAFGSLVTVDFGSAGKVTKSLGGDNVEVEFTSPSSLTEASTSIVISGKGIAELNCSHRCLTMLDISKYPELTRVYCDNNLLTSIDISKNTALIRFDCWGNKLSNLDISKNTALTRLLCDNNHLTSLDVSNNIALDFLSCWSNKLTSLDVSKNIKLKVLWCANNQLERIEVNNNPSLDELSFYNNLLTTIDLSRNPLLIILDCSRNYLTTLDLSQNPLINNLSCTDNKFNYTTLLARKFTTQYRYAPQSKYLLGKRMFSAHETIDLSSQLTVKDADGKLHTTIFSWKKLDGSALVVNSDYTENNGKFTFLRALSDSIYCQMDNDVFPDFKNCGEIFITNNIAIGAAEALVPSITMTTSAQGSPYRVSLAGKNGSFVTVDFGAGGKVTQQLKGENAYIDFTSTSNLVAASTEVTVFGADITGLYCGAKLTALDASKASNLAELFCGGSLLTTLDIIKNIALTKLDCSRNKLTSLDVSQNVALVEFYSNANQLTTLDVSKNIALTKFDCSSNKLTSLDVKKNVALTELNCGVNQLITLDVSKNTSLIKLDCNSNKLANIDVSKSNFLSQLFNQRNQLTYATLPQPRGSFTGYLYAPQAELVLPKITYTTSELVDLSSQLTAKDADGVAQLTSFAWKTAGGNTLVAGVDYSLTGGKFIFLKAQAEPIYCEMTNAAFPRLDGGDVLKTTSITVGSSGEPVPSITLTTTKQGAPFTIILRGVGGTSARVDFGVGGAVTKQLTGENMGVAFTSPNSLAASSTEVKIYGNNITGLYCGNSMLTMVDVSKDVSLVGLDCNNNQLTSLSTTKNVNIKTLNCSNNRLAALDLSNNTALATLECGANQLTALDISKNEDLTHLNCAMNQLVSLDVSNNTELISLLCQTNRLTMLDVSNNAVLSQLLCRQNQLTSLDVSKNSALTKLWCETNQLTYMTIPQQMSSYTGFTYSPQAAFKLSRKDYEKGEPIDLSNQRLAKDVNGTIQNTTYSWYTTKGALLNLNTDYTENDGIFIFTTVPSDSVYCHMSNLAYPNFDLSMSSWFKTPKIKINGPTGIDEGGMDALKIYISNGSIVIDGLQSGDVITVVNVLGSEIHHAVAESSIETIPLPIQGLYIVKAGTIVKKVVW